MLSRFLPHASALPPQASSPGAKPRILLIAHSVVDAAVVGGTELHIRNLVEGLSHRYQFFILYPLLDEETLVLEEIVRPAPEQKKNTFDFSLAEKTVDEWLSFIFEAFKIDAVHLHHVLNHSIEGIFNGIRSFSGPKLYSIHDHHPICRNLNLLFKNERYCGLPKEPSACADCILATNGWSYPQLENYRRWFHDNIALFDRIVFPSESVRETVSGQLEIKAAQVRVIEHGISLPPQALPAAPPYAGGTLRVAFIGTLVPHKGRDTLSRLLQLEGLPPIEWHIWGGPSYPFPQPRCGQLIDHGTYRPEDIVGLLTRHGIHLGLLPSICPETFSLALSEFFIARIPVIGSSLGAVGRRLSEKNAGWVVDPNDETQILSILDEIVRTPSKLQEIAQKADFQVQSLGGMCRHYDALYQELEVRSTESRPLPDPPELAQARQRSSLRQAVHEPPAPPPWADETAPERAWSSADALQWSETLVRQIVFRTARYFPRKLKDEIKRRLFNAHF